MERKWKIEFDINGKKKIYYITATLEELDEAIVFQRVDL